MKKKLLTTIVMGLALIFIFNNSAMAGEYFISLASSGTTTVASGTSEMIVNGASGVTYINLTKYKSPACVIQVKNWDSGLTVAEIERRRGGDNSGVSFTLRYKESIVLSLMPHVSTTTNVFNGTLFSGTTNEPQMVYPNAMGYIAFEFISGITPIGAADFIFKVIDQE